MKFNSVQGRFGFLFLAFVLILLVSVGATFTGIESQKKDALVVNLAGRQRMLVQQMSRLALEIELGGDARFVTALQQSINTFDGTLTALRDGGQADYLPGQPVELPQAPVGEIRSQLDLVKETWADFHQALDLVLGNSPGEPAFKQGLQQVEQLSPGLLSQTDQAVRLFEAEAARKVTRLRQVQMAFLVSDLFLLAAGIWVTRRTVLEPLKALRQAAERIAGGDLKTPVPPEKLSEIQVVTQTFDAMRHELLGSQEALVEWNRTLEKRVAQRTQELNALYEVNREISSRLDVQYVLRSVTEKARALLGAEVATLCLLDENQKILTMTASAGPSEAVVGAGTRDLSGLTGLVLSGEQAQLCSRGESTGGCGVLSPEFRASHLAAPLRVDGKVIGALCVGSRQEQSFSGASPDLLTRLANSAAIALENARLYTQAERVATLEERQRLAAEMHDGLAQTMSYLGLAIDESVEDMLQGKQAEAQSRLLRARQATIQAVAQVRQSIAHLLDDRGLQLSLQERLQALVDELRDDQAPNLSFETDLDEPLILPHQDLPQALSVAREAILNARRHAEARQIVLRLACEGEQARVSVCDNGAGFDPDCLPQDGRQRFGLRIMQARAEQLHGRLEIYSRPGGGTQVDLIWPLKGETQNG